MTFSARLRLALALAALLPTALITIIVVVGITEQIKRIENRDAEAACRRFSELLDNASSRIGKNLHAIIDDRNFQLVGWKLAAGGRPDRSYFLPLMTLDFVEYMGLDGAVCLSATRPALIGQKTASSAPVPPEKSAIQMTYENDLHGSHPSLAMTIPTENGSIRGGLFLDGMFGDLASAVTRSTITFTDNRASSGRAGPPREIGTPYRSDGRLCAVPAFDSMWEFFPTVQFEPYSLQSLFANFLTAVAAVILFSLLVVIPAGLYFSSRTRREFDTLTQGAMRVASGDFSQPITSAGEDEFAELADSFNHMMKQLTEYRQRLITSQKIAAWQTIGRRIAHEVKNPLTPIAVAADDLRHSYREGRADFEQVLAECTDTIKGEVHRLKKLIEEFSEFARMPAPEITAVSASEFVQALSVLFRDDLATGRLKIVNDLGQAIMRIDPEQMRQVVINLVKNSLEAGCGRCRVCLSPEKDAMALAIEDDGPGFPKRLLDEGITPYFSTKEGGSGLGLIICQRIVYDHGGTLTLENIMNGGARVRISVPMHDAENPHR